VKNVGGLLLLLAIRGLGTVMMEKAGKERSRFFDNADDLRLSNEE